MIRVNIKYSTLLAACLILSSGAVYAQTDERTGRPVRDGDFRQLEAGSKGPWQHPNTESSQANNDDQTSQGASQNASEYRSQRDQASGVSDAGRQSQRDSNVAAAGSEQETIVYFEFDSAELSDEAKQSLQNLAQSVSENEMRNLEVVIEGHTDSTGPAVYNEYLSEKRAKSVQEYLKVQEVPASNWEIVPAGDSSPLADNDSRDGREENRRAEVKLQQRSPSAMDDDDGVSFR